MKSQKVKRKKSGLYFKHFDVVFFISVQTVHLLGYNPQVIFFPFYVPFLLWYYR